MQNYPKFPDYLYSGYEDALTLEYQNMFNEIKDQLNAEFQKEINEQQTQFDEQTKIFEDNQAKLGKLIEEQSYYSQKIQQEQEGNLEKQEEISKNIIDLLKKVEEKPIVNIEKQVTEVKEGFKINMYLLAGASIFVLLVVYFVFFN